MAKRLSKFEKERLDQYHPHGGHNYMRCKVDAILWHNNGSIDHESYKVRTALSLLQKEHRIITEAVDNVGCSLQLTACEKNLV